MVLHSEYVEHGFESEPTRRSWFVTVMLQTDCRYRRVASIRAGIEGCEPDQGSVGGIHEECLVSAAGPR